jgi:hypothetical protein
MLLPKRFGLIRNPGATEALRSPKQITRLSNFFRNSPPGLGCRQHPGATDSRGAGSCARMASRSSPASSSTVDTIWLRRFSVVGPPGRQPPRRVRRIRPASRHGLDAAPDCASLLVDLRRPRPSMRLRIHDRDAKFLPRPRRRYRKRRSRSSARPSQRRTRTRTRSAPSAACARGCFDRLLIVGRRHLEHVLRVYIRHYNLGRSHRGLDLKPLDSTATCTPRSADDAAAFG